MVLDPIPQSLPVHFFGSRPQPPTSHHWMIPYHPHTGWLRLVGSLKLQVSSAKEPYKRDYTLQKRPTICRSLLLAATPYHKIPVRQSLAPPKAPPTAPPFASTYIDLRTSMYVEAKFDVCRHRLYIRVCRHGNSMYVDIGSTYREEPVCRGADVYIHRISMSAYMDLRMFEIHVHVHLHTNYCNVNRHLCCNTLQHIAFPCVSMKCSRRRRRRQHPRKRLQRKQTPLHLFPCISMKYTHSPLHTPPCTSM